MWKCTPDEDKRHCQSLCPSVIYIANMQLELMCKLDVVVNSELQMNPQHYSIS